MQHIWLFFLIKKGPCPSPQIKKKWYLFAVTKLNFLNCNFFWLGREGKKKKARLEKWNFAHRLMTTDRISSGLITCSSENIIFNLLLGLFIFFIITLRVYNLTSNIILYELRGCTVMLKIRCMGLVGTASNSVSRKWITNWQAAIPYTAQCNFTSNKLSFAESYAHHPPRQCKEQ